MRVGVIGTGNMGTGFARQLAGVGHDVLIGSRAPEKAGEVAGTLGVAGGTYRQAAEHGEAVLLTVPWWGVDETVAACGDLSGRVLVDVTNPYTDATYSTQHEFPGSSGGEQIAAKVVGARVVKCFNHVYAQVVHSSPDFGGQAATAFLCGDDPDAKELVAQLARSIGYDPVDAGPLSSARYLERLAGLMVTLAYGLGGGTDQAIHLLRR